jgi:CRISPR-associated protein Cmr2
MTAHLLQIAVGPVQEFIAQARRTRDLWYGSHLLSEVSRAVARSLAADARVRLIFPALDPAMPEDKAELDPCEAPLRPPGHVNAGKPPLAVANIILAEIDGADPRAVEKLAADAREAMLAYWKDKLARRVKNGCGGLLADGIDEVWDEQIETFIEFSAAWSRISLQDGDCQTDTPYKATRKRLAKAIVARKGLRDFEQWQQDRPGERKSSLDGARVSVLKRQRPARLVGKYRLTDNEQLDAVGLVKRAGGETAESRGRNELQFVPIVNVALAPWVKLAQQACKVEFDKASKHAGAIGWPGVTRDIPCGRDLLGFDANIFQRSRWWPESKELEVLKLSPESDWRTHVIKEGDANIGPLLSRMSEPYPYVACLAADGDHMGAAIDALGSAEAHRGFSRELAKFARAARDIVESEAHLGSLVYSGGDDVLAFLPVSTALACADKLQSKFAEIMEEALQRQDDLPTLSVGLGIGHIVESMGDLLELGRKAEKLAKGGHLKDKAERRNALTIILDKRSGGTRQWRAQWTENPVSRLLKDRDLLARTVKVPAAKRLSSRKVYQIAGIVRRLPVPTTDAGAALAGFEVVLREEVKRALTRIDGGGSGLTLEDVGLEEIKTADTYTATRRLILQWVDRMLIARAFAESVPESKPAATATKAAE